MRDEKFNNEAPRRKHRGASLNGIFYIRRLHPRDKPWGLHAAVQIKFN
jgi:hypothetical protein